MLLRDAFWFEGVQSEQAGRVFLKAGGRWHRFFMDCGNLFWRAIDAPDALDGDGHVRRHNVGEKWGLVGCTVERVGDLYTLGRLEPYEDEWSAGHMHRPHFEHGRGVCVRFAEGPILVLRETGQPTEDCMLHLLREPPPDLRLDPLNETHDYLKNWTA